MHPYINADRTYRSRDLNGDKEDINRFMSYCAHVNAQLYPNDDAISLCYTISYFIFNKLPWDGFDAGHMFHAKNVALAKVWLKL